MKSVRLSPYEIKMIQEVFVRCIGVGAVYLFGSRADVYQKGGDIDLYITLPYQLGWARKKIEFLVQLKQLIGEQKIDVAFAQKDSLLAEQVQNTGVLLWKC